MLLAVIIRSSPAASPPLALRVKAEEAAVVIAPAPQNQENQYQERLIQWLSFRHYRRHDGNFSVVPEMSNSAVSTVRVSVLSRC